METKEDAAAITVSNSEPAITAEQAWSAIEVAAKDRELQEFKDAVKIFAQAEPHLNLSDIEQKLRAANFSIYMIALEKEIPKSFMLTDAHGKAECKYTVSFQFSSKPPRAKMAEGWPESVEENLERLKNAGFLIENRQPLCFNCNELGHTSKSCSIEKMAYERVIITCPNCNQAGHRLRDCPAPKIDPDTCKNCGQPGHRKNECTEPRSAANVECRLCGEVGHFKTDCPQKSDEPQACFNCGEEGHSKRDCPNPRNPLNVTCNNCEETGHFSKECPHPRNPKNVICNNCDEKGHFSKECPKPRDWARVKCRICGELGHGVRRCPMASADGENAQTDCENGTLNGLSEGNLEPASEYDDNGNW